MSKILNYLVWKKLHEQASATDTERARTILDQRIDRFLNQLPKRPDISTPGLPETPTAEQPKTSTVDKPKAPIADQPKDTPKDQEILNQIETGELVLKSGMSGRAVELIQNKLKKVKYLTTPVNGEYDAATYTAVTNFQKEKGLKIDGIVGKNTYAALYGKKPKTGSQPTVTVDGKFTSPRYFKEALLPRASAVVQKLNLQAPPVAVLAQWSLESANGSSPASSYNYAGLKAMGPLKNKKGKAVLAEERYTPQHIEKMKAGKTTEELVKVLGKNDTIRKRGREVTIDQWYGKGAWQKAKDAGKQWCQVKTYFASFDNYDDFVNGYLKVIGGDRYRETIKSAKTVEDFALGLAKKGYATASPTKYAQAVVSKSKELENLA